MMSKYLSGTKRSEITRKLFLDPAFRKRHSAGVKKAWNNPKIRAAGSAASKKRWSDPKWRKKRISGIRKTWKSKELIASISGKNNVNYKNGRWMTEYGYMCVSVKGKRVYEHRIIMGNKIGRVLKKHETVHHINGIRHDNRLENLELWTKKHGTGVRKADIKHCLTCTCASHKS